MFIVLLCAVFIVNVVLKSIQPLLLLKSIVINNGARNSFAERRLYSNRFRINRQG